MVEMFLIVLMLACGSSYSTNQGQDALKRHDLPAAEQAFRTALERNPNYEEALSGLGWTYHIAGKTEAARSIFQRCEQLHPNSSECLRGLGSIALSDGKVIQARAWIEAAQRVAPSEPKVESSVALLAMVEGRLDVSKAAYQSLADRFPNQAEYRLGLGECLFRQDDSVNAADVAADALTLPDTPIRYRAMLFALHARALLKSTAGVEDPKDCDRTAPPVHEWLLAAQSSIEQAISTKVDLADIYVVQRQILRRQTMLTENCPSVIFE